MTHEFVPETERTPGTRDAEQDARVVHMRDSGASWLEIQQSFGLTRQAARYAYQRGKREERRGHRAGADGRRAPS